MLDIFKSLLNSNWCRESESEDIHAVKEYPHKRKVIKHRTESTNNQSFTASALDAVRDNKIIESEWKLRPICNDTHSQIKIRIKSSMNPTQKQSNIVLDVISDHGSKEDQFIESSKKLWEEILKNYGSKNNSSLKNDSKGVEVSNNIDPLHTFQYDASQGRVVL